MQSGQKVRKLAFILFLLYLSIPISAYGVTYDREEYTEVFYLSNNGDGSNPKAGTTAHAWDSADVNNGNNWNNVDLADNKLGPNDCLVILDDDADITTWLVVQNSGLSGKPITVRGEAGGEAVISCNAYKFCVLVENKSYLVFKNFTVKNAASDNFKILAIGGSSEHIVVENVVSEHAQRWGFWVTSSTDRNCDYITFHNCESSYNGDNGFHVTQNAPSGDGVEYWYCNSHHNGMISNSHGFSCYGGSTEGKSSNVHWYFCEASYNKEDAATGAEGYGWLVDSYSTDCEIISCYAHHNEGTGFGIGLNSDNNGIYYSISANNDEFGIYSSKGANINLFNNTIYNNGLDGSGNDDGIRLINCSSVNLKNNILLNHPGFGLIVGGTSSVKCTHNCFYGNASSALSGVSCTNALSSDPQLWDKDVGDYRLLRSSPCIDAGVDVGLTRDFAGTFVPQGNAPDIGAFEKKGKNKPAPPNNLRLAP